MPKLCYALVRIPPPPARPASIPHKFAQICAVFLLFSRRKKIPLDLFFFFHRIYGESGQELFCCVVGALIVVRLFEKAVGELKRSKFL